MTKEVFYFERRDCSPENSRWKGRCRRDCENLSSEALHRRKYSLGKEKTKLAVSGTHSPWRWCLNSASLDLNFLTLTTQKSGMILKTELAFLCLQRHRFSSEPQRVLSVTPLRHLASLRRHRWDGDELLEWTLRICLLRHGCPWEVTNSAYAYSIKQSLTACLPLQTSPRPIKMAVFSCDDLVYIKCTSELELRFFQRPQSYVLQN